MQFNKSYRLLRYLNRRHSIVSRYTLGAAAWLCTWLFTQSAALSGLMRREFIQDDFRLAFRRAAWLARHVFPTLDLFKDPFFDFTMDTSETERAALRRFLQRYSHKAKPWAYLTDLLYLQAADIHGRLENEPCGLALPAEVAAFYDCADTALAVLAAPKRKKPRPGKERGDDFSKADAIEALRDLASALPLENWPWYVISGTFLGLHREGGFLAHDYDIDVGINAEDINIDALITTLDAHPSFATKKVDLHVEITQDDRGKLHLKKVPALMKLIHENGLNLDIFIHHTDGECCWHGSIIHRWENTPFELSIRELEGVPVLAPADADRYLTENYGAWRTPVKEFDCTTGTPNLVVSRNFLSIALFLKRFAVFCETDADAALKLRRTLICSGVLGEQGDSLRVVRRFEKAPACRREAA